MKLNISYDLEKGFNKLIVLEKDNKTLLNNEAIRELKKYYRRLPIAIMNTNRILKKYDLSNIIDIIRAERKISKNLTIFFKKYNWDIETDVKDGNLWIIATKKEV